MSNEIRSLPGRTLALLQIALLLSAGCAPGPLAPTRGAVEYQAPGMIPVPGGVVNAAGGNLLVERVDLSLDGVVAGGLAIGAVYNSSAAGWIFSFAARYDGSLFTDASGHRFGMDTVLDGSPIEGTHWIKVDADSVQTKGGLRYDFDAQGRLAAVRWATLDYPRFRYTWSAAALDIAQCTAASVCTAFYQVAFDAQGRPVSLTDVRGGRSAEYVWDASGHLVIAKTPLEVAKGWLGTRYEYTGSGLLTAITSSEGERIEYGYQSDDRIRSVRQIGEGDPTHWFEFYSPNTDGLYPTLHTNPLGARTRLYFDASSRLCELEFVETGERRTLTWQGLRPASVTLESGATTTYAYAGDDPVAVTDAAGNTATITYAPGALNQENPRSRAIARIDDALGLVEERTYDGSGRLARVGNGEGESVDLAYNPVSLVASLTQPTGAMLTFPLYGQHGHWLDMDGAVTDARSFDPVGNPRVESAKGRRGGVLSQEFDANRWLATLEVAATDSTGVTATGTITLERRSDGQPLAVQRPYGGDHEFVYDALGRLASQRERVDGQWQTTVFERDLAGNTTARTRPNGMREEWQYDGYGRVTRHRALRATLEGEAVFSYANGQLVSMFDSVRGAAEQYGYDAAGRLVLTTYGYGETRSLAYDARSRVSAEVLAVPGQVLFDVGFEYDLANRLLRTIDRAAQEVLIEHEIVGGELAETRYGNGLVRAYVHDAAGLLTSSETRNALDEVIESTAISRTLETNPLRLQVRVTTTTPLASTEEQYWLDAGEQLSDPGKRVFGWSDGASAPRTYAYDELSNQVSVAGGASFTYNAERNRLLSALPAGAAGPLTYSYDGAGYATSRSGVPITWTATGRLASYGSSSATWDLSGRLVALDFDGVLRRFDLFGGRIESNATTGAVGSLDLGEVSLAPLSGSATYQHRDFRANVSFVSDAAGQVTNHYRYSPYGVDHAYGAGSNSHTFDGKLSAGPFMILGARIYEPAVGRFLSPDPFLVLTNQYTYTSGNAVLFSDAAGLVEVSRSQQFAIAKAAGWVLMAAAFAFNPPASAIALWLGVGGFSVTGGVFFSELVGAFAPDSGTIPTAPSPSAPPPPPPSGPPSAGSDSGIQIKVVVVSVGEAPVQSCSPSQLSGAIVSRRLLPGLLLVNLAFGAVWWRRRRKALE